MATDVRAAVEIPAGWLEGWDALIRQAWDATRVEWHEGGVTHSDQGDVSIRVETGDYQSSPDGQHWSDGDGKDGRRTPPVIHVLTYEGYYGENAAGRFVGGPAQLREAVESLAGLSGSWWRHGEVVVTVRGCGPRGRRGRVVASWVVAEVKGRGVTFYDPPEDAHDA
jgi:hypothetical protein